MPTTSSYHLHYSLSSSSLNVRLKNDHIPQALHQSTTDRVNEFLIEEGNE